MRIPLLDNGVANQFRALIESFSDYVWQINEAGIYTYVSSGVKTTLGYEPDELLGKTPFSIMPPDEAERVSALFAPIAAQRRAFSSLENAVQHKDRRRIILETSGRPIFDDDGTYRGYFGIDRNITERRRIERELAESELKFRSIFDAGADGILVVDIEAHKFILANRAICEMLGYETAELLQMGIEDIHPPRAWSAATAHLRQTLSGQSHAPAEIPLKRKDGTEFTGMITASPMMLGGRRYAIGLFRDMTERHRQEERLREEREKLKALVEQNVAGIAIIMENGTIGYANPFFAALAGCAVAEVVGRPLLDFVPIAERAIVQEKLKAQLSGAEDFVQLGTSIQAKDGRIIDILVNASRATFASRPASIAVVLDITERKRAEVALHTSERKLSIALQMAHAGYWEYDVKTDRFTFNDNFYQIFGTTAQAVGGYTMTSTEYARRFVHPDDMAVVANEIKAVLASTDPNYSRDIEHRIIYADGTTGYISVRFFAERDENGRTIRTYGVNQDLTLRKRNEEALRRSNRALKTLSVGNATLVRAKSEPDFLEGMCRVLVEVGGYAAASIGYAEQDETKTVRPVAWAGDHPDYVKNARISWADVERGRGPTGTAIRTGNVAVNVDFAHNPDMWPWRRAALKHGFASSIAFPLRQNSVTFGALTIYARQPDVFDPEEVKLLTEFSDDLAFGITALRTRAAHELGVTRLKKAMTSTVLALAAALEGRDPYTAGHQRNVAKLSAAISAKIGVAEEERDGIYLAAVIHDIGKIQVPGEILSKLGKLSDLEMQIIQTHARAGYDIVKGVDFPVAGRNYDSPASRAARRLGLPERAQGGRNHPRRQNSCRR